MFIFIQTIFVYLFLALVMITLGKNYAKTGKFMNIVAAVSIYAIVFGFRYGVGGDYFSYLVAFQDVVDNKAFALAENWEEGFYWLMKILAVFNSSEIFFTTVAFIQLIFMLLAIKQYKNIFPYVFFSFVLLGTWLGFANTTRQIISLGFWILAVKFATEKKVIHYYAIIAIAILFHKSAVILLPLYPLIAFRDDWFRNTKLELVLLAIAVYLPSIDIIQRFIDSFGMVVNTVGYEKYIEYRPDLMETEVKIGVGFFISLAFNIVVILYSEKAKKFYNDSFFNILYSIYFMGMLLHYAFINSVALGRIVVYFYDFQFIIIGFFLYYFYSTFKRIPYYILGGLVVLTFAALMFRAGENWSLFVFNWQDEFFYVHRLHDFR